MSSAETETEPAVEPTVDTAAEGPAPVRRRPAAKRPAKLDALLAAAVDRARQGVLEMAPAEQVGNHVGVVAEAERLVVHRFESKLPGYIGWQWFASLSRAPRSKEITVCEIGLLPSEESLLAPDWVPWAERVRPEEAAAEAESIAEENAEENAAEKNAVENADENDSDENDDDAGRNPGEAASDDAGVTEAGRADEAAAPAVDESADQASADPGPSTSEAATSVDTAAGPSAGELTSNIETVRSDLKVPETIPDPEASA
jgi:hypothetical protein